MTLVIKQEAKEEQQQDDDDGTEMNTKSESQMTVSKDYLSDTGINDSRAVG